MRLNNYSLLKTITNLYIYSDSNISAKRRSPMIASDSTKTYPGLEWRSYHQLEGGVGLVNLDLLIIWNLNQVFYGTYIVTWKGWELDTKLTLGSRSWASRHLKFRRNFIRIQGYKLDLNPRFLSPTWSVFSFTVNLSESTVFTSKIWSHYPLSHGQMLRYCLYLG